MSAATVPLAELERLMNAALQRSGATPAMARATAHALAAAERDGIPSHGASRIPQYCGHLKNGRAKGAAVPTVAKSSKAACLVDAGGGLAFEACGLAVQEAIWRAREFGVAFVSVTNSNHFGVAAHHLEPVAAAGLVGLAFGNSPAAMPAWGGRRSLLGTNPVAAVFPRRAAAPLVVDVSLSAVARGKIMVAARDGKPIHEGWAVDKHGNPTTDSRAAIMMRPRATAESERSIINAAAARRGKAAASGLVPKSARLPPHAGMAAGELPIASPTSPASATSSR